jgi:hypothetical protein
MVVFERVCLKVDEDEEMVVSEGFWTIYMFRSSLMPQNYERSNHLSVVQVTNVRPFQVGCVWGVFSHSWPKFPFITHPI